VVRVRRAASLLRAYGLDMLVALAALEGALEVVLRERTSQAPRTEAWLAAPGVALLLLPLLARRRFPFGAPAAVWAVGVGLSFADGRLVPYTAGAFVGGTVASFLLGNLRDGFQVRVGLAIALGGAVLVVSNNPEHTAADLVFTPVLFGIAWLAGYALRERAAQAEEAEERASLAERERESAARVAVAEERARIARELHDIVAHAVSVMVLQVGAVRHRLPEELAADRDALRDVEAAGRAALGEMRRLLGAMRDEGREPELAPQPGLDGLDGLLERVRRAGLAVDLRVEGDAVPLPAALDLSAYRIVQEGLTNALKHAGAEHAHVTLCYEPAGLRLEVRDDGAGVAAAAGDGPGHGLVGVRERVKIYGGEVSAGPAPGGGFLLSARLPLEGRT
jgi:signal transduction histidine kinase